MRIAGPMQMTLHGKLRVAQSMFRKGQGFIAAAMLLNQENKHSDEGFEWVVLHLWCQGIEVGLKGLLRFATTTNIIRC